MTESRYLPESRYWPTARRPDLSRADVRDTLWIELRQAHLIAGRQRHLLGYRDGLLAAYAILTGQSEEDVYESLQDALIATAEEM